jgi:hypothetical protein
MKITARTQRDRRFRPGHPARRAEGFRVRRARAGVALAYYNRGLCYAKQRKTKLAGPTARTR